jgi:ribonuclease T2
MPKRVFVWAVAALAALASILVIPNAEARSHYARESGTPGQFDFYVLSLSWSPSFCESNSGRNGNRSSDEQCNRGRPYAFVVHGLWPQYERGFPQNCGKAQWVDRELIRSMTDIMPAYGLVLHEWKTHGTCSGLSPDAYFRLVRRASEHVKIPPRFMRVNDYLTISPDEVERAFIESNPGLAGDMVSVNCDRRHLREVRVCMNKDLSFRACPEAERRACRSQKVVMPPVRGR